MTSDVQKKKLAQGYTKKPQQCNNCAHYKSELVAVPANGWRCEHVVEKAKRCGIGGFAVQSSASCKVYAAKTDLTTKGVSK